MDTNIKNKLIKQNKENRNKFDNFEGFGEYKNIGMDLLGIIVKLLDKYEIEYFLISGTLLGYVRHNDFIPWDDDIDLLVSDDFVKKINIISNDIDFINSNCAFHSKNQYVHKIFYTDKVIQHNGFNWPFVDIFTYSIKQNELDFFYKRWKCDEFFPSEKVLFNELIVSIPKNPQYFLEINYGKNYMDIYESSRYCHKVEKFNSYVQKKPANEFNDKT
jgi:phosphorylcholine metabolism protein LicD